MIYCYRISAPGNDLDGETFEIQSASRDNADDRARGRIRTVFSLSLRTSVRVDRIAAYISREAQQKAEAHARESGVSLTPAGDAVFDVLLSEGGVS